MSPGATPPPLPTGYVRLTDRTGLVSLGVPHTWFHAFVDGSDATLTRLVSSNGLVGVRWRAYAKTSDHGGVFGAADPLSTDGFVLLERDAGVDVSDLDELDRTLRSGIGSTGSIRSSAKISLDGKRGLRYQIDAPDNGEVVHETVYFFVISRTIVDLTFTGAAADIAKVTATIHFRSG